MTQWQPGMIITAARLNDFTPVPLTTTPTAAAGFSVNSFSARKAAGMTEWAVVLSYSGTTITANSGGNIADTLCMTLPADCRPAAETYAMFEVAGTTAGSVRIMTNGQCLLTTLYPTSSIGTNTVKFSSSFAAG
ncbi:hypothetical protein [Streptomyces hirsutus]|uniref:hypothetical protein n=1 Tax=Streptomyces hirsutus TaxID=35620 RepID=UPI003330D352